MLSNTTLEIPVSEQWLEYDPGNETVSIKNATTIPLFYVFNTATGTPHTLIRNEMTEPISQKIYFKTKTDSEGAKVHITKGVTNASEATVVDKAGRSNLIGNFGEQWATDVKNDILAQFSYGKSTFDLKPDVIANGGSVTIQEDNLLTVSSGVAVDGLAEVESFSSIRYRPGHTVLCQFTALFTNHAADQAHQWIGMVDGQNGFAIGFIDGEFAIVRMRAGVHDHIFVLNGNVDMSTVNWNKLNVFRITFGYLGAAPVSFEMMEPGQSRYNTIHTLLYHNENETTHIELPYLPVQAHVENNGNNTDIQIRSGSWQGGVMGLCAACGNRGFTYPYTPGAVNVKTGVGTTPAVLASFKSVETFQSFANKIRSELSKFSFTPFDATEDTEVTVQLVGGAAITGGTYDNIDAVNSTMQVNNAVTGFTGGRVGLTLTVLALTGHGVAPAQSTPADLDTKALQLFLDPGNEYAIIAFTQNGTVSITWDINWVELF